MGKIVDIYTKLNVIFNKKQKKEFVILILVITISSLFETLGISAVLPFVNIIITPEIIETNKIYLKIGELFKLNNIREYIIFCGLFLILVYFVKNLFLICVNKFQQKFIFFSQKEVSCRVMRNYINQEYLFFTTHNVAELQRDVFTDVAQTFSMVEGVLSLLTEICVCFCVLVFLFIQDFETTMFLAVLLLFLLGLIAGKLKRKLVMMGRGFRDASKQMNKWIIQSFTGIKDLKANNREEFFYRKYENAINEYADIRSKEAFFRYIPKPIVETVIVCGILGIICTRILQGADVVKFVPTLSVFIVAAVRMLPSFSRVSNSISVISYNYPSLLAVYDNLKGPVNTYGHDDKKERIKVNEKIELKHVDFSYPTRPDKMIISDLNLIIEKNNSVALVGSSGAGKTTLADLILGLIKPSSGSIFVDGQNIQNNMSGWQQIIGYIPQNIYLLDDTIRANVAYGEKEEDISDEAVWIALEKAQADEFVKKLDDGIYSTIGDRGIQISGGQRQRLGIARALYRNPELLILDEATSALDNETESAVMDAIYNLSGKVTMLVIAHRLSTVLNCNIIYEVKEGKVTQKSKEELMQNIEENS